MASGMTQTKHLRHLWQTVCVPIGPTEIRIASLGSIPSNKPCLTSDRKVPLATGEEVHRQEIPEPVECRVWAHTCVQTVWESAEGRWELGKGKALWRPAVGSPASVELAKAAVWRTKYDLSWEAFIPVLLNDSSASTAMEERGFRMPAWQILDQLRSRHNLTAIVGPPRVMTDLRFQEWIPAGEWTADNDLDGAIVILDAFEPAVQAKICESLPPQGKWIVVANPVLIEDGIQELLSVLGDRCSLLPPRKEGNRVIKTPQVYAKNWWESGSKRLCQLQEGGLVSWTPETGSGVASPVGLPPITCSFCY